MNQGPVERIERGGVLLCMIVRARYSPSRTGFVTAPELNQQVGFVVYEKGGEVARHTHRSIERRVVGTSEVIVVRSGRCLLDVYDSAHELVTSRELFPGDLMLMLAGGHGFRMLEDTVLIEVKQGPYSGDDEKERF